MADWSLPTLSSTYTNFLSQLQARDTDLALGFDGTTSTSIPTGTIRWNSTLGRWQKWSGTAWGELAATYALTGLSTTGAATIGTTLGVTGVATLSGGGTTTTPATADNSTAIASTAFVKAQNYATLASPSLTGTPVAPTAALNTNTTQIATTAFVINQAYDTAPTMNGTAAVGTSLEYARGNHVHPTDTSRAAVASPTFTGTPLSTTAAVDTNTTQIATTAFVVGQAAGTAPVMNGTTAIGTSLRYARQDHVHATDTSRAPLASPTFTGTVTIPTGAAITGYLTTATATSTYVALTGNQTIDGVKTFSSSISGSITGNAATADQINKTGILSSNAGNYRVLLGPANNTAGYGGAVVVTDASRLYYNPSTDTLTSDLNGNATTATKLATGRTISLTGDVTGTSASFDGSGNASITAVVVDDSHNHTTSTITDIASGTYTPTLTNQTNLASSSVSANDFFYTRVGTIVNVSGKVTITATTANSLFQLRITIPVARGTSFGSGAGAAGCAADDTAAATARVATINATQLVTIDGRSNATTAKILGVSFSYTL
jgi:hypothetical protein